MAKKKKTKAEPGDLLRISSFILLNASLFHEVLAGVSKEVNPISSLYKPLKNSLIKEWEENIQPINYKPIFDLALRILKRLPSGPKIEYMLEEITKLSTRIASSGTYLSHDLMGRIYHRLLLRTTGGYYATYYTSIPAAVLLANLIIKTQNSDNFWDFGNIEFIKNFRIIDPACGSGTLLSAIYSAIRNEFLIKSANKDIKKLHNSILEEVIFGFDILDYASHLTLTSLSLHNPKAFFKSTNIYTLPIGIMGKNVYLGSLDYLPSAMQIPLLGKEWSLPHKKHGLPEVEEIYSPIELKPESFDAVIMNPPFSRSSNPNIKFGFTTEEVKKKMNKELRKISEEMIIKLQNGESIDLRGIGQAGLGAYFVFVAHRLLKNSGRLGLVIPRTILSGVSWEKVRKLLYWNYEIEIIISNFDTGEKDAGIEAWNWSENTDLGEVLIIARKTNIPIDKRQTCYINFWNKPSNAIESVLLSQQIKIFIEQNRKFLSKREYSCLNLNDKEIGSIYFINQKVLDEGWLYPCLYANPNLNVFTYDIKKRFKFLSTQLDEIDEINHFGIDCGSISKNFKPTAIITKQRAVWGYEIGMDNIEISEDYLKYVKVTQENDSLTKKRGSLLIPYTMYLQNHKVCSFYCSTDVISNAFWTIRISDEIYGKFIVLWLNSTFGFIELLTQGCSSKGFHFEFKQGNIKKVRIPNIKDFKRDKLSSFYNSIKEKKFNKFAYEFELASQNKGLRKMIDDFFIEELGLKIDLSPYYKMLSKEPILTLERM